MPIRTRLSTRPLTQPSPIMSRQSQKPNGTNARNALREIAASTLQTINEGAYEVNGTSYDLTRSLKAVKDRTLFFSVDSTLSGWAATKDEPSANSIEIMVEEISTLAGARLLSDLLVSSDTPDATIGILNFASAKNPGGGFQNGAQAQEESIARSSTLYPSLTSPPAQKFFALHNADPKDGFYSHSMIYTPNVVLIRDDKGTWEPPLEVDIVSSAAVNAGVVRRNLKTNPDIETEIVATMKERMARVLYLFEEQGVRNVVLGSFGTGVFRNSVPVVAGIWKELLVGDDARFRDSFDRVVFAVLGKETFEVFERTFVEAL